MYCRIRSAAQLIFSCILLISFTLITGCSSNLLDFSQPSIVSISPAANTVFSDTNQIQSISIKFSKTMNQSSVENAIQLNQTILEGFNNASVNGLFSWPDQKDMNQVVFTPLTNFTYGKYTLTVTASAEDSAGNDLLYGTNITFQISGDTTLPTILSTVPANNATNLSSSNFTYAVFFSKSMDPTGVSSLVTVSPSFNYQILMLTNNTVMSIQAVGKVNPGHYTLTINPMQDIHGNTMRAAATYYFTVGSDFSAPIFLGIYTNTNTVYPPLLLTNGLNSIDKYSPLYFIFNKAVNIDTRNLPVTITPSPSGNWQCSSNILSFIPSAPWDLYSVFQVAVSSGIQDFNGNQTINNYRANIQISSPTSYPVVLTGVNFMTNATSGTNWQFLGMSTINNTDSLTLEFFFNSSIAPTTVLNNLSISTVYGSSLGSTSISMVQFASNTLANDSIIVSIISNGANLYQISLNGGTSGIHDTFGNWISNTIQFYYMTEP